MDFYKNYVRQLQICHPGIGNFIKHIVIFKLMINFSVFHFSVHRETIVTIYLPLQEVG